MNNFKILVLLSLMLPACVNAQSVSAIRDYYAEVKKEIGMQERVPEMQNNCTLSLVHNVPGIGVQKVNYRLYFSGPETDCHGVPRASVLRFASCSFNVAARNCYEEYLYDSSGCPIFIYCRHDDTDDASAFTEKRIYYAPDGSLMRIMVHGTVNGRKSVVYDGNGTGCDSSYLTDTYDHASKISRMYREIDGCIKR